MIPAVAFLSKCLLPLLLAALAGPAWAQRVLDLPQDFAFNPADVSAFAAHAYGTRLRVLRAAGSLDTDPALKARIQRLFPRIERAAEYELPASAALAWEVHACRACDENASALPGGKLLVSADFIERLALTDDELGYLLAHEAAHVVAQHAREYATAARYLVDNGRRRSYDDIQQELDQSLAAALRLAEVSASQELEADYVGFVLGAHAGFAPGAMLSLLRKLAPGRTPLLGTHPGNALRLAQARAMLETARRLAAHPLPPQ
jgi:predicted Zn-dependent protease